jgi:hypothetical protein
MMSRIESRHWTISSFVVAILKMAISRNCSISGINSGHHYLPTFQIVKIRHCRISSKFDMWVENDVLNWFPTLKNFYRSPLKMVTSRNCSMSGINSGLHYLPTYQIVMISDNVEFLWYILKIATGRTAKIQHCRISSQFDMWVDNDVPNWFSR